MLQDKIHEEFKKIHEEFTKIHTKIDGLNTKFDTKIDSLKSDVATLVDWQKKLADASEIITNNFFEEEFRTALPAYNLQKIPIAQFYTKTSTVPLTDFDGCFITSSASVPTGKALTADMKKIKKKLLPLKNNARSGIDNSHVIIIEKKLTIDKRHVDDKIEMYKQIRQAIRDSVDLSGASDKFKNMVQTHGLDKFSEDIIFLFACDSMSSNIINYISSINEGLDEETYQTLTFAILQDDVSYKEFAKAYFDFTKTQKPKKYSKSISNFFNDTKKIKSYSELRKVIDFINDNNEELDPNKYTEPEYFNTVLKTLSKTKKYLESVSKPYRNIKSDFDIVKNKLGYIKQQTITTPLFQNKM